MRGVIYLAWRYLAWHRVKTGVLVATITLIVFVPSGLSMIIDQTAQDMTARAVQTPLLLGARGSPLELTLNSLYFSGQRPAAIDYRELAALTSNDGVGQVPLFVRYESRGFPIVGTTLDYFDFRRHRLAAGRPLVSLGEAVLGAAVAAELDLAVGDTVVSAPETLFDLAGVYPLKMPIVGVLAPTSSSDDRAIFVDLKTSWVIAGLGHGHQALEDPAAAGSVLQVEDDRIVANASLVQYNEINEANQDSFHFHGDLGDYPISAILTVPESDKAGTLILGRYQSHASLQMISPKAVVEELLETVFAVQRYVLVAMLMVGLATIAVVTLVFLLSLRLRQGEMLTMARIGGAPAAIRGLMLAEMGIVLLLAAVFAGLLSVVSLIWGDVLFNSLLSQAQG
ncbi:MAG: ABC transporter permease [Pseudomonadales bacterium]